MINWIAETVSAFSARRPANTDSDDSETAKWFGSLDPEAIDYKAALTVAADRYDEINNALQVVEKKAEWLFDVSLVAIGALIAAMKQWSFSPLAVTAALIFACIAAVLSARARVPGDRSRPFSARDAIRLIEQKCALDAWLAASTHCATTDNVTLLNWKADQVVASFRCLAAGAIAAAIGAIVTSAFAGHSP